MKLKLFFATVLVGLGGFLLGVNSFRNSEQPSQRNGTSLVSELSGTAADETAVQVQELTPSDVRSLASISAGTSEEENLSSHMLLIRSAPSGQPVQPAKLSATQPTTGKTRSINAPSEATMKAGRWKLQLTSNGWRPLSKYVTLAGDSESEITLQASNGMAGVVLDQQTGLPLTDYRIEACYDDGKLTRYLPLTKQDENPEFSVVAFPIDAGRFRLSFSAPGYADQQTGWFDPQVQAFVTGLVIRMVPSIERNISILVSDVADGAQLQGAQLLLTSAHSGPEHHAIHSEKILPMFTMELENTVEGLSAQRKRGTTDEAGRCQFKVPHNTPFRVVAYKAGWVDKLSEVIDPELTSDFQVRLVRGASVTCSVQVGAEDRLRINSVHVENQTTQRSVAYEADCELRGLADGDYVLSVHGFTGTASNEIPLAQRAIQVRDGLDQHVDFRLGSLQPGARLDGYVDFLGIGGVGAGFAVLLDEQSPLSNWQAATELDEGARFEHLGLPKGDYQLVALTNSGARSLVFCHQAMSISAREAAAQTTRTVQLAPFSSELSLEFPEELHGQFLELVDVQGPPEWLKQVLLSAVLLQPSSEPTQILGLPHGEYTFECGGIRKRVVIDESQRRLALNYE